MQITKFVLLRNSLLRHHWDLKAQSRTFSPGFLTDGYVSGGPKDEVDHHRKEGGVQTKHWSQGGQKGIGHT